MNVIIYEVIAVTVYLWVILGTIYQTIYLLCYVLDDQITSSDVLVSAINSIASSINNILRRVTSY